ncbi:MAG: tail fiber domain-containing protein [Saprospiraceae bacterium]|nr:tail fiber domain-containing protein [Saprospiraceae bacterium]
MKKILVFLLITAASYHLAYTQGNVEIDGTLHLVQPFSNISFYDSDSVQKGLISFENHALRIDNDLDSGDVDISSEDQIRLITGNTVRLQIDDAGHAIMGGPATDARLALWHNSDSDKPTLELRETAGDDFTRLQFRSLPTVDDRFFSINANPGSAGEPKMHIYYQKNAVSGYNLISIDADDRLVGIHKTSPEAHLHIKQRSAGEEALALENDTDGDKWSFEVAADDLLLYYNGSLVGTFDDASGSYSPSDQRLKHSICDLSDRILKKVMQLKPRAYYYNHTQNPQRKEYGFIAQEIQSIFPEIVGQMDESEYLMLKYTDFIPILTKAIQEQQRQIVVLQEKVEALTTR